MKLTTLEKLYLAKAYSRESAIYGGKADAVMAQDNPNLSVVRVLVAKSEDMVRLSMKYFDMAKEDSD